MGRRFGNLSEFARFSSVCLTWLSRPLVAFCIGTWASCGED